MGGGRRAIQPGTLVPRQEPRTILDYVEERHPGVFTCSVEKGVSTITCRFCEKSMSGMMAGLATRMNSHLRSKGKVRAHARACALSLLCIHSRRNCIVHLCRVVSLCVRVAERLLARQEGGEAAQEHALLFQERELRDQV